MKKNILLFLLFFSIFSFSQEFKKSNTFHLSKIDKNLTSLDPKNKGYVNVYLKNKKNRNLKKMKVYWETYENDGVVSEINNSKLINVNQIIRVDLSNCGSECDNESYYWLITKQGKWIELPLIAEEDFELTQTVKNYTFKNNEIVLTEEKFKILDYKTYKTERIYTRILQRYSWDGKSIKKTI